MKRRYPPIPDIVKCPGGDVRVFLVSKKQINRHADPGEELVGYYDPSDRCLFILKSLRLEQKHRYLWHELVHAGLEDAGIRQAIGHDAEEAVADSMSSLMMRALYG